jgi:hypothetical protein
MTKGITYQYLIDGMRFRFPGHKEGIYTFNVKESVNNPIPEPVSLQHEFIQIMLREAIPYTTSQPIPTVKMKQSNATSGYWSLWHLEVKNQFESGQIIQPIFISSEGENFSAFAQSIWDKVIQENDYFNCTGALSLEESKKVFEDISEKSENLMQKKYEAFESSILLNADKIKANKEKSFVFQEKQMNRIGIENIKQSRLTRLHKEKETWEDTFQSAVQIVPTLTCLLMVKIINE